MAGLAVGFLRSKATVPPGSPIPRWTNRLRRVRRRLVRTTCCPDCWCRGGWLYRRKELGRTVHGNAVNRLTARNKLAVAGYVVAHFAVEHARRLFQHVLQGIQTLVVHLFFGNDRQGLRRFTLGQADACRSGGSGNGVVESSLFPTPWTVTVGKSTRSCGWVFSTSVAKEYAEHSARLTAKLNLP